MGYFRFIQYLQMSIGDLTSSNAVQGKDVGMLEDGWLNITLKLVLDIYCQMLNHASLSLK